MTLKSAINLPRSYRCAPPTILSPRLPPATLFIKRMFFLFSSLPRHPHFSCDLSELLGKRSLTLSDAGRQLKGASNLPLNAGAFFFFFLMSAAGGRRRTSLGFEGAKQNGKPVSLLEAGTLSWVSHCWAQRCEEGGIFEHSNKASRTLRQLRFKGLEIRL